MSGSRVSVADGLASSSPHAAQSPPLPAPSLSSSSTSSHSHLPPSSTSRPTAQLESSSPPQDYSSSPSRFANPQHHTQFHPHHHNESSRQRIKSEPSGSPSSSPRHQRHLPSSSSSRQHHNNVAAPHYGHHQSSGWLGPYEQSSPMMSGSSPHHHASTRPSPRSDHHHHNTHHRIGYSPSSSSYLHHHSYSFSSSPLHDREGGSSTSRKFGRDVWHLNQAGGGGGHVGGPREAGFKAREFDPAAAAAAAATSATPTATAISSSSHVTAASAASAYTPPASALAPGNGVPTSTSHHSGRHARRDSSSGGAERMLNMSSGGGGVEPSSSVQSLVESINDEDVLRLTQMTKKMVENANQAQKRNRIISPPSSNQVLTDFQPSEKTLQLSNQYKAMMESRYAPIFVALDSRQPLPNPLVTLRQTMAKIDAIPRAIVTKYNTARKISMEASSTTASGGAGGGSGGIIGSGHVSNSSSLSRSKKSKDKHAFVSKVAESQCIWDVDHMKTKASEMEARYQANASNSSLRYMAPPQSTSMDSLATSSGTMEHAQQQRFTSMTPAAITPVVTATYKVTDDNPQLSAQQSPMIPTSSSAMTSPTTSVSGDPSLPIPTSTPTTISGSAIPPVSTIQEDTILPPHQTHAGEGMHHPILQPEPSITTTISPAQTATTMSSSSSQISSQTKKPSVGEVRSSLEVPSGGAHSSANGSSMPLPMTGSFPYHLHVPVHSTSMDTMPTSGSKRSSILGIFGKKGHKKTGPEEAAADKATDRHRTALYNHQETMLSAPPGASANSPRLSGTATVPTTAVTAITTTTSTAPVAGTLSSGTAERRSFERTHSSGMPEVVISPTYPKTYDNNKNKLALSGSFGQATGATNRKASLEEQQHPPLPGLGHGLLFHSCQHEEGVSTEDELPIPTFPQGERLEDSQDEADVLHKRSSLRRFTDKIMWKRQHKGLSGLHEHLHAAEALKRPMAPVLNLPQHHHNHATSWLPSSQPSSGRNSLDGGSARPKGFSLARVMSATSSPVLEPGSFDAASTGGGANTPMGGVYHSHNITAANSATITPRMGPMTPVEGLQPIQRPTASERSPMLHPRQSFMSGQSQGGPPGSSQDQSPSMRGAITPNEDPHWTGADKKMLGGTGGWMDGSEPILVDIERIPKAILDQLKESPALVGVSWDLETVDLRPLVASGNSLPSCHEFFGITSAMKEMEAFPIELQPVDLLDIHVRLDYHEAKDYLRMRAHIWDTLEMRLDEELKLSESFVKNAFRWTHDHQGEMDRHIKALSSSEDGDLEDYCYEFEQLAKDGGEDGNGDDENGDGDVVGGSGIANRIQTEGPDEMDSLSDATTGDTLRTASGDDAEAMTDTDDQEGDVDASSSALDDLHDVNRRATKGSPKQGGDVGTTKRVMPIPAPYRMRKPHIVPLETMRANKQRELHAHVGSMSSMYVRDGFKSNLEQTRESMAELSAVMMSCRERLTHLQETMGKSLQDKEHVYKGIIDNFTVEWNDSYFVKLKDVEEQIQVMNQKRIENPWMDMLLILLSWLIRGLFYIVEGVTIVIIIFRHAWSKAKATFQTVRTARRERERQRHGNMHVGGGGSGSGAESSNPSSPSLSSSTTSHGASTSLSSGQRHLQHLQQRAPTFPASSAQ